MQVTAFPCSALTLPRSCCMRGSSCAALDASNLFNIKTLASKVVQGVRGVAIGLVHTLPLLLLPNKVLISANRRVDLSRCIMYVYIAGNSYTALAQPPTTRFYSTQHLGLGNVRVSCARYIPTEREQNHLDRRTVHKARFVSRCPNRSEAKSLSLLHDTSPISCNRYSAITIL